MNIPPHSIIIFGPQGTGKALRAREIARKWRLDDPDCNVAIFDDSYSTEPEADVETIVSMIEHGITVIVVTTREAHEDGIWICDYFGIDEAYTPDAALGLSQSPE